ncbi:MAG: PhoH family protein, partial [Flavobacteriales bacterium]|nr:PhoH family protein [Flavobacteriales bacterium]
MADIQSIISFYERCYRAESKETIIFNFLGSQVEKRFLFEEYSITDKSDALTHFTHEQLADWLKYLRLHQKEKHQVHGEIFLVGKLKYLGKNRLVCAPLVITSVDLIQENEGWRFVPNYESSIINPAIANLLTSNLDLDDSFRIELDNWLPKKSLDVKEIQGLLSILEKYGLNNQLDFQNSNVKASDISKLMKSTSPKFISSSGVGIVEKNKTEKEILADLNDLRDQYSFSKLLKSVLLKKELEKNEAITDEIIVPADLSLAQTKAIKNSQDYDVSIINGPPGTGKSFTIAAMAINAFANGQSVLISSKSDRAISVIQSKLKSHFHLGEIAVLAGTSRSSKSSVRRRIKSILSGTFQNQITNVENVEFEMKREFRALDRYEQEIIDRERGELKDGEYLSEKPDNFWTKIQKHFIAKRSIKNAPFWKLVEVYRHGIDIKNTKTQKYLSLLYKATVSNVVLQYRSMFQKLLKRVDSGTNL